MFSILISEKGGETKRLEFDRPEITIGRVQGNDIVLPKGNVSKRHSRIVYKDGKFIIVDLKSTNGTYVNGRKITAPLVIKGSDKIYIGDFIMNIEEGTGPSTSSNADLDGAKGAPPPPPRPGSRPAIATVPAIRVEQTAMDVAAGMDDENPEAAASAKSPHEPRPTRPTPPPPPPAAALRGPTRPGGLSESARAEPATAERSNRDADANLSERSSEKALGGAGENSTHRVPQTGSGSLTAPLAAGAIASAAAGLPAGGTPSPGALPPVPLSGAQAPGVSPLAGVSPQASAAPSSGASNGNAPGNNARAPLPRPTTGTATGAALRAPTRPTSSAMPAAGRSPIGAGTSATIDDPQRRRHIEVLGQVISKTLDQAGMPNASAEQLSEAAPRLEKLLREQVEKVFPLPAGLETEGLAKQALADLFGSGPLDDLLADDTIHEIAVASHDRIYVDRGSGQSLHERVFSSSAAVQRAISRLVVAAGGAASLDSLLEIRLPSGALLQAALPPHARVPSLVLRRPRKTGGRLQDLVNQGVLSAAMSEFLEVSMRERRNMVVSGYGRGVMLGALGGATSAGARVVTVEPVSELDLSGTHAAWIGLIGRGQESRNLLGLGVRMHPDHLMITDVRGPEALDVVAALCGGQGVVVGVDAASARESLGRLESLARLSNESPTRRALREELGQSVNLAIHVGRTATGAYRVMEIAEVTTNEESGIELIAVFTFKPEGGDGQFVATGHVPAFSG